jgi:hypothetical protein
MIHQASVMVTDALKNEQLTKSTSETGNSRSGIVEIKHRLFPP